MGKLQDFLLKNEPDALREIQVPVKPFPHPFRVRAITEGENKAIRASCRKMVVNPKTHQMEQQTDGDLYTNKLVAACCVDPNFKDAELQAKFGVVGEAALIDRLLNPGQFGALLQAVQEVNGFDEDVNDLVDEAKN